MNKTSLEYYWIMQKIAAVFIVVSLLSCFSINYTFPLHRGAKRNVAINDTQKCEKPVHTDGIVDRTKKMAANIENALKKLMDADSESKAGARFTHDKPSLVDNDLSNYEQLVIMKKYPYLDLKELENYHSMPHKNVRQSLHAGPLEQDPSFCESLPIEGPNVDITNRGLTGFAIPTKLMKDVVNSKADLSSENLLETDRQTQVSLSKPTRNQLLEGLQKDILKFEKGVRG